jgi:hypothetical protein
MLCMADRGFNGVEQWRQASTTGADLLWRCSDTRELPVQQLLSDGSFLSSIAPSGAARAAGATAITVRVIEYAMPRDDQALPRYRLLTTLLDPKAAPALELARLYHQRWEIEAVFDELKTHLRQGRRVLRSKTPELVQQEFYGWVGAHAVPWLLHQAPPPITSAELSFKGHRSSCAAQPDQGLLEQTQTPMVPRVATPPPICGRPAHLTALAHMVKRRNCNTCHTIAPTSRRFDPSPICLEPRPPARRRHVRVANSTGHR